MYLSVNALLQGGKYRIVRFINSGGFGCTYEAEHVMLGKKLAIKEFFVKDFCNRDEATAHVTVGTQSKKGLVNKLRQKFIDEARAICKLHHPNIVTVSDVFEENGTAYFVMDYIEGHSLNEIIDRQGKLSEKKALHYIRQVADALDYVHSNNRLHLDVKPGNIMIDSSDRVILIDFGTSKQYDEQDGENTSTLMGMTRGYAPLEQMGNDVGKFMPATDIYALGATLYKLLTGVTPPSSTLLASGEKLPALPNVVSTSTRQAIAAAMQLNKTERPQSVEKFLSLLNREEEDVTVLEVESENTSELKRLSTSEDFTSSWKKGLMLLFACIVAIGGMILWQPFEHEIKISPIEQKIEKVRTTRSEMPPAGNIIDLGLSVMWADRNVGADSPDESGWYFPGIMANPESEYTPKKSVMTIKDPEDISGNHQYDAAHANWGDSWRLPTKAECQELVDRCEWTWTTQGGHNGYKVTGPNGNSIFLPAAGWRGGASLNDFGERGYYWSSTFSAHDYNRAFGLYFRCGNHDVRWSYCSNRQSIRPVFGPNKYRNIKYMTKF